VKSSDDREPTSHFFMIFTPHIYVRLKKKLSTRYARDLIAISKLIKPSHTETASWWIQNRDELKSYSPIHWFYNRQISHLLQLESLLKELNDSDEFGALEEEIFDRWNQSEFADIFLKLLNQGKSLRTASEITLNEFDLHLLEFAHRHILREHLPTRSYRYQTSLGEYKRGKTIQRLLPTTLHLEGKELDLLTINLKEMKNFSHRIELALKVIKFFNSEAWERFKAFTDVIIPIKQVEFVSFSHQDLPGYSMINMYDRDFVDLMDDLLHENGHHHLNHYLNLQKLIEEPQETIYYSPWRQTLRPLRGIYHAYFTFYWAFDLFATLASARDLANLFHRFSPIEIEKIYYRAIEEYWMLRYSFEDLKWARRKGLILDSGWELIVEQNKKLNKYKNKILIWEKKLKTTKKDLTQLKRVLAKAKIHYQK
jgi:hypothetical protein